MAYIRLEFYLDLDLNLFLEIISVIYFTFSLLSSGCLQINIVAINSNNRCPQ